MTASAARPNRTVLGSLLESRAMCACIAGAALVHLVSIKAGFDGWQCPVRFALGIPCPGCGLGRAGALLLRGRFAESVHIHAFAGVVLAALTMVGVAALLPRGPRLRLATTVTSLERRWSIAPTVLWGLVVYWLLRFAFGGSAFIHLVT